MPLHSEREHNAATRLHKRTGEPHAPIPVLHVLKSMGLGGTEKTAQLLMTHLDRSRYAPAVYSPVDGERAAPLRAANIPTYIGKSIDSALSQIKPAIIHVHRAGWPEPALMRPIVLYARAHRHARIVETNVFGRYDPSPWGQAVHCTLFVSAFCAKRYETLYGIRTQPPRFQVLYNPVDADFLASQCLPPEKRDFSRPVIGRLSRPDPGKWSSLALDFLPELRAAIPDFTYLIIGGIASAREFARRNGLGKNIQFLKPVVTEQELAGFLNRLSVFVHANDTGESFGMCIAEAMCAGLPVVTHPCAFPRDNAQIELVEHGRTGFVATTAHEYAQAILWLFSHPEEARRMGQAARKKALSQYAARLIAGQLADVYDELLQDSM